MVLGPQGNHLFQETLPGSISAGQVHVWHLQFDAPFWLQHEPYLLVTLSLDEQQHMHAFSSLHRQQAYMMTRALCRLVLSHYVPTVPPQAWCFQRNAYGRPSLLMPNDGLDLDFNMTHTHSHVLMAVASSAHSIGVDLESWASNTLRPALVARFFSPAEQATLNALRPEEYTQRFVALWVLKEAYIKARGMGLSIPLHEFTVAVCQQSAADGGLQAVLESTPPDDCVDLWHLELAGVVGQHALALCARRTHANQGLTVKHCSAQHLVR